MCPSEIENKPICPYFLGKFWSDTEPGQCQVVLENNAQPAPVSPDPDPVKPKVPKDTACSVINRVHFRNYRAPQQIHNPEGQSIEIEAGPLRRNEDREISPRVPSSTCPAVNPVFAIANRKPLAPSPV